MTPNRQKSLAAVLLQRSPFYVGVPHQCVCVCVCLCTMACDVSMNVSVCCILELGQLDFDTVLFCKFFGLAWKRCKELSQDIGLIVLCLRIT